MTYAIIDMSGKQYWIEMGKYYDFNRIPIKLNQTITLNRVLLLKNSSEILIGKPYIESLKVIGKIVEHIKGKKNITYKMQPKKKTRKKQGHRQKLTRVLINDIIMN